MSESVITVKGTIDPGELGSTLVHEHLLFAYPGFAGDITFGPFDHDAAMESA